MPGFKPIRLPYGLRDRNWKRWIWWGALFLFVVCISLAADWWGADLWWKGRLLYRQGQCLNYRPAADEVVYEQDPARARQLLAEGDQWHEMPTPVDENMAAGYRPDCWDKLGAIWSERPARMKQPIASVAASATLFLGERTGPDGRVYLAQVECRWAGDKLALIDRLIEPETRSQPSGTWYRKEGTVSPRLSDTGKKLKLFAGQRDPANPARFIIPYELDAQRGELVGTLTWMSQQKQVWIEFEMDPVSGK